MIRLTSAGAAEFFTTYVPSSSSPTSSRIKWLMWTFSLALVSRIFPSRRRTRSNTGSTLGLNNNSVVSKAGTGIWTSSPKKAVRCSSLAAEWGKRQILYVWDTEKHTFEKIYIKYRQTVLKKLLCTLLKSCFFCSSATGGKKGFSEQFLKEYFCVCVWNTF